MTTLSKARQNALYADTVVNVKDYGAVGDGVTDDTDAVTAANALGKMVFVPSGTYDTTMAATSFDGPYWGDGQLKDSSNNLRAKWFSAIKAAPSSFGTHTSIETAFNGDISHVQMAMEHRITGASTLGQPTTGYTYTPEAYARYGRLYNSSGYNHATASNTGRTAACFERIHVYQAGQGDCVAYNVSAFVTGAKAGATSFLANPAASMWNGDMTAGQSGVYLNPRELVLTDAGYDVAGIGDVVRLNRSNNTGALGVWWAGYRVQSQGTEEIDVAFSLMGPAQIGMDLTMATFPSSGTYNNAAILLKAGQRMYLNASGTDATGLARFSASTSDYYFEKSTGGAFINWVVANASAFQIYSNKIASPNGWMQMKDGVTAPSAISGQVQIYVDQADGDLKVVFGDGTVKTIVVDT